VEHVATLIEVCPSFVGRVDIERARAEGVILQIAKSLGGIPPFHQSFLAAEPIRRVLEAATVATAPSSAHLSPRKRSQVSA
jgi:hypothetical protein